MVAQWAKVAGAEVRRPVDLVVARLDRHRHAARAQLLCGGHQDLRLEHEVLAGHAAAAKPANVRRIQALPALAVGDLVAGAPGDAPVAEPVGQAAVARLVGALAQARADHDPAAEAVAGGQQARDVVAAVLAVAVHRDHRVEAAPQGFGEAVAQARALAHAAGVAEHRDRQAGQRGGGAVVGSVVDDDDIRTVAQRAFHHVADAQGLVEGGDDHGDALGRQGGGGDDVLHPYQYASHAVRHAPPPRRAR